MLGGVGRGPDLRVGRLLTSLGVYEEYTQASPKSLILGYVGGYVYILLLGGVSVAGNGLFRVFEVVGGHHRPVASLSPKCFRGLRALLPGLLKGRTHRIKSLL